MIFHFLILLMNDYYNVLRNLKKIYKEVLENPFDFSIDEAYSTDYESLGYVKNKKQLKERWRQQLKFSSIANYHDLKLEQEQHQENLQKMSAAEREKAINPENDFVVKSEEELEKEAREATLRSLDELYDFIDDRQRKDWFSVYVNAVVEEFDPTYLLFCS